MTDAGTSNEATLRRAGEVDREIGLRLRALRGAAAMTQAALAEAAGLTFQQIQKYETGKSRLSASMLCRFAEILDAPSAALLPAAASDPEGRLWDLLAGNRRLTRLLGRLQSLPPASLERALDRMEASVEPLAPGGGAAAGDAP